MIARLIRWLLRLPQPIDTEKLIDEPEKPSAEPPEIQPHHKAPSLAASVLGELPPDAEPEQLDPDKERQAPPKAKRRPPVPVFDMAILGDGPLPSPGFYFAMPDDIYHAVPFLDQSGIKNLRTSPADYFQSAPWNYDPEEENKAKRRQFSRGHAVECIVLEGRIEFDLQFAKEPEPEDFTPPGEPDSGDPFSELLVTGEDLSRACENAGLKKSGSKFEMAQRLMYAVPEYADIIFDVLADEYRDQHEGKTFLHPDDFSACLAADAAMKRVRRKVEQARNKVAVFWIDEELGGIPCKAQIDQVAFVPGKKEGKAVRIVDIKSFVNSSRIEVERCAAHRFAATGCHIQGAFYERGLRLTLEQAPVSHDQMGMEGWIEALAAAENDTYSAMAPGRPEVQFIFIQDSPVNIIPRFYDHGDRGTLSEWGQHADATIRQQSRIWLENMVKHGIEKPWGGFYPPRFVAVDEVPPYLFME